MPIIIETPRIILKQMCLDDAQDMFNLNSDPEVVRYTGDGPFDDIDEVKAFIKAYNQYEKHGTGRLNMFNKTNGEYLGWCGLKHRVEDSTTDIGYRLPQKHWNMGYATEAAIACLNYGFDVLNLNRIIGVSMKANRASIRVFEKIGLSYVEDIEEHGDECVLYHITKN